MAMHRKLAQLSDFPHGHTLTIFLRSFDGFSLIEVVVVIAILGIITSIAIPSFVNIQKDSQISQAKSTLATVIKECEVAALRGKPAILRSTQSALGKLSGYELEASGGVPQYSGGVINSAFLLNSCRSISAFPMSTLPTGQPTMPIFEISFDPATSIVSKNCEYYYGSGSSPVDGVYSAGCIWDGGRVNRGYRSGSWD